MTCRSCGGDRLTEVLSLGNQYLSDFRTDDQKPPRYPLDLFFCHDCYLVQLGVTAPRHLMYHERYGFKSGVNDTIRADLKSVVEQVLDRRMPDNWLDIASNDGTLLSYVPKSIYRLGVDPIGKLCAEAEQHASRIVNGFFHPDYLAGHKFDVITSISMFYDLDDPNEFVAGVKSVLADDGLWVIQQNYLGATLRLGAIDNVCHEHITYFSLLALEKLLDRHDLQVVHVSESSINGGSFRTLVTRKGVHIPDESVRAMRNREFAAGLHGTVPYEKFGRGVGENLRELNRLLREERGHGRSVYIYGASTRGGTLWQAANLDNTLVQKAVERNPEKVGKTIASIGVPIISEKQARAEQPDYMLISPWFLGPEFEEREAEYLRRGGHFIYPLPAVRMYPA